MGYKRSHCVTQIRTSSSNVISYPDHFPPFSHFQAERHGLSTKLAQWENWQWENITSGLLTGNLTATAGYLPAVQQDSRKNSRAIMVRDGPVERQSTDRASYMLSNTVKILKVRSVST